MLGSVKTYWRFRLACAYALKMLTYLPATHPFWATGHDAQFNFSVALTDYQPNGPKDKKLLKTMRNTKAPMNERLKAYYPDVIDGFADVGYIERTIISYIFDAAVYGLQCQVMAPLRSGATARTRREKLPHKIKLKTECHSHPGLFDPPADQPYLGSAVFFLAFTGNEHYEYIKFVENQAIVLPTVNDELIPENVEILPPTSVVEYLRQEVLAAEEDDTKVYEFDDHQKVFEIAKVSLASQVLGGHTTNFEEATEKLTLVETELKHARRRKTTDPQQQENLLNIRSNLQAQISRFEQIMEEEDKRLNIEARLQLKDSVSHLRFTGTNWYAVLREDKDFPAMKVRVLFDWVLANYHPFWIKFMMGDGREHWFTKSNNMHEIVPGTSTNQNVYIIFFVEIRKKIHEDARKLYYILGVKEADQNNKILNESSRIEEKPADYDWLVSFLEKHDRENNTSWSIAFDTSKDRLQSSPQPSAQNCRCFPSHGSLPKNHGARCYVKETVTCKEENERPVLKVDTRQISGLRWNEKKQTWQGMVCDAFGNAENSIMDLEEDWVNTNYPDLEFLEQCRVKSAKQKHFVKIPAGAAKTSDVIPDHLIMPDAPKVIFQQKTSNTCISYGLASALAFLKETKVAFDLFKLGKDIEERKIDSKLIGTKSILGIVCQFMRKSSADNRFVPHKIPVNVDLLDPECVSMHPKLVVLMGDDNDTTHAVTIVGKWIFDSAFPQALPLIRESLNLSCGDNCLFIRHVIGYEFKPHQNQNKKAAQRRNAAKNKKNKKNELS